MSLAVCYSSYLHSEVVTGTSSNAAVPDLNWIMSNVLPDATGLEVTGIYYRYTVEKDEAADLLVTIRNEANDAVGYIYSRTDDWSGQPGNTIVRYDPLPATPGTAWGDGEIVTEGEGTVIDPTVRYNYRYDTCYEPITDPNCPGFEAALYKYLLDNDLLNNEPSVDDPYYDEWVQMQLDSEADIQEDTIEEEEAEEEESLEERLGGDVILSDLGGDQAAQLVELNNVPQFDVYYESTINGGVYEDALTFENTELPDNTRALRNLANDATHRTMVRSQYE